MGFIFAMKSAAYQLSILLVYGGSMVLLKASEEPDWTVLFDGDSTDAWRGYQMDTFPEGSWAVNDGILTTIGGDAASDIVTRETFFDFELRLEWRVSSGGNSGVFFHVSEEPDAIYHFAPEYQILDDEAYGFPPDSLQSTGALYAIYGPPAEKTLKPVGEFNTSRVIVSDGRVEHWLNGSVILRYELGTEEFRRRVAESNFSEFPEFSRVGEGPIGLQHHGGEVGFREIRIRKLDTREER